MYHHVCGLGTYLEDRTPLCFTEPSVTFKFDLCEVIHICTVGFFGKIQRPGIGLTVRRGREERASVSGDWAVLAVSLCHLDHGDIEILCVKGVHFSPPGRGSKLVIQTFSPR